MNCARLQLSAATTTIFVRDGWLIIEVADEKELRGQLNSADGSRLLSVAEVSERTGFTSGAVRGWIKRAILTAIRIGKEYRVREADLEQFLTGKNRVGVIAGRVERKRRKPFTV
jgi:excisionase family DNA binding protein